MIPHHFTAGCLAVLGHFDAAVDADVDMLLSGPALATP
jgi:hypothetical protein